MRQPLATRRPLLAAILLVSLSGCRQERLAPPEPSPAPAPSPAVSFAAVRKEPGPSPRDEAPRPLRVLVAGDVIAHRPILARPGALGRALEKLGPLFQGADAVVVNHESATGVAPASNELAYAAPETWSTELRAARVTAITLANNHACDLGPSGLNATLTLARTAGLSWVGAAAGEGAEGDPWRARVLAQGGGHKVCGVGWTTHMNGNPRLCAGKIAYIPDLHAAELRARKSIQMARTEGCDAVIAMVHAGQEYAAQGRGEIAIAERLAEAGADAVLMHHPHIPSPLQITTTKDGRAVPLFTSVGNLVTNQGYAWRSVMPVVVPDRRAVSVNAWTRLGVVADLVFDWPAGASRPDLRYGYHLIWNARPRGEGQGQETPEIQARLIDSKADAELIANFGRDKLGPNVLFESPCWLQGKEPCSGPQTKASKRVARSPKR